jgi:hypothetical protein
MAHDLPMAIDVVDCVHASVWANAILSMSLTSLRVEITREHVRKLGIVKQSSTSCSTAGVLIISCKSAKITLILCLS